PRTRKLLKNGRVLRLPTKPFQLLALLVERAGEPVTREEIRERLWGVDTFVEFDDSLNHTIQKLREVLCDSAEKPRYIETLPRQGYRLTAPIETVPIEVTAPTAGGPAIPHPTGPGGRAW